MVLKSVVRKSETKSEKENRKVLYPRILPWCSIGIEDVYRRLCM